MDITVYLPDEIGQKAKAEELNLSRMLRDAVTEELERRAAVATTLEEAEEYKLNLTTKDGEAYIGKLTGTLLAEAAHGDVYLRARDEAVVYYDHDREDYWEVADPEQDLRGLLNDDEYSTAMRALGITPELEI